MPNEAEGSLNKRTNSLESAAQVSPKKSGPYDLTKLEAALTISNNTFIFIRNLLIKIFFLMILITINCFSDLY